MNEHKCRDLTSDQHFEMALNEIKRMEELAAQGRTNEIFGTCRVYCLWPLNPASPVWRASTYKNKVVIRALNGERAREIAKLVFGIGAPSQADDHAAPNPWSEVSEAGCERISRYEYPEHGSEAILYPPTLNHEGWFGRLSAAVQTPPD